MTKKKTPQPQPHHNDDSIIREIEEAVKRDRVMKLAKKYAPHIVALTAIIILSIVGFQFWKTERLEAAKIAGEKIYTALNDESKLGNISALENVKSHSGSQQIVELTKARILTNGGNIEEAKQAYLAIAANKSYDLAFRELASLNHASILINSGVGSKDVKDKIRQIADNGKVMKYSALELLAAYEMQYGSKEEATKILQKLVADSNTPAGITLRAKQIVSGIDNESEQNAE